MRITFLGAAETVTGSCYLVETDQTSFLIDCGLHQGHPEEVQLNRAALPFEMDKINFMLLTHALSKKYLHDKSYSRFMRHHAA
jgi:metallo-beta-lactamase family protein